MPDIFVADPPHRCPTPERKFRPTGSIWRCDDCGTYWCFRYTDDSWGPVWIEVYWWQWRIRRTIRRAERKAVRP